MKMINAEEAKRRSNTSNDKWTWIDKWHYYWNRRLIKKLIKTATNKGKHTIFCWTENNDTRILDALKAWLDMYGYDTQYVTSPDYCLKISWEGKHYK